VKMMNSQENINIFLSILNPILEVLISFVIGAILSVLMKIIFRWFKKPSNVLCITIAFIMLAYWLAEQLHGSPLLACMTLGAVLVNIYSDIDKVLKATDGFTPPIFMIFFVISGAGFKISALAGIGIIGLIYVIVRIVGKTAG